MLRPLSMMEVSGPGAAQAALAERILARIADPARPRISGRVLIVVAHPDDETLGCGALLPRLDDVLLVHVTDGAPPDAEDARRHGFADATAYAEARSRELAAALALAGVPPGRSIRFAVPDQVATFKMAEIAGRLVPLMAAAQVVLTHAYEGGHPDHDATAFAVDAAAQLIGAKAPAILEMPFYRAGPDGRWLRQTFEPHERHDVATLRLNDVERALKACMVAAHASQAETLAGFGIADETFRIAPAYDFLRPPNDGRVLYDGFGWQLDGSEFLAWLRIARIELGFEPPP